jgi:AraC-like DNA-binding protein
MSDLSSHRPAIANRRGAPAVRHALYSRESRSRLLDLSIGLVENLSRDRHEITAEDFCQVFQICLPYRGLGVWHVGRDDVVADANQVLFVSGGESYRMSGPVRGGYAELIVTPDLDVLSEIARTNGRGPATHPLFRRRSCRAVPALQGFRTRFMVWATGSPPDDLEAEEIVVSLLRAALRGDGVGSRSCGPTTARIVRRAKMVLEMHLSSRVRLMDVARMVGASPAYLTDTFRRIEGISLHRYLTHLRLSRALVELPHANDLTAVALETGFSSHSHFSSVFRRAFGCTPSEFRETARVKRVLRRLPAAG